VGSVTISSKKACGFTLLEMMVTLVVAGIMLSITVVQLMPDEQAQLRDEAQRLAYLLEQAGASARAGGLALAWSGNGREFRFWKKNKQGEWRRVEQDTLLHPRSLPDEVRVAALEIAGRQALPGEMLLLSPETAAPMFRVRLVSGERQMMIAGNGLGAVAVVQP
jgi:general secretion pathway protein H